MNKISTGVYTLKKDKWANVSKDGVDFIAELLQVDATKRLTAQAALNHPFVLKRQAFEAKKEVDLSIVDALVNFSRLSAFRRCCMTMMAWSLTSEERSTVEEYFLTMDESHHGAITYADLQKVMVGKFHLPDRELKRTFNALDMHHDHEIHFSDFLAAMVSTRIAVHEELLRDAFRKFDTHDAGFFTVDDLRELVGDSFEGKQVDKLLTEVDLLKVGKVNYHEFAAYIKEMPLHLHGDEYANFAEPDAVVQRGTSAEGVNAVRDASSCRRGSKDKAKGNGKGQPDACCVLQ